MSSMQEYLAAKYMSGAKADAILARSDDKKRKKRKKEDKFASAQASGSGSGSGGGIMLVDEDGGSGWGAPQDEQMDEDAPTVETKSGEFKTARKSNWAAVHTGTTPPPEEVEEAVPEDEKPQLVAEEDPEAPRRGGLRTAAQLREEEERRRIIEEREAAARTNPEEEAELARLAQETVYRDSSGKKLDMKAERAAEKRRKKEADEKEAAKMEWGKGVVQRGEKEAQARRLAAEQNRDLARYANDAELNREQKEVSRWNDPAANFLTKKKSSAPRYPQYKGSWAPNRFNIPPGCRWDGVDRSTGFEAKYFQNINAKRRREQEAHAFGTEDM